MTHALKATLALALLAGAAAANEPTTEHLDRMIRAEAERWSVPGLAVGVVDSNTLRYLGTAGVASTDGGPPIGPDTVFALASTTKAMVAAGVLLLADEGRLSLDDLATEHLPALHFQQPWMDRQVTVRDLLTHRTGIASTDLWRFFQDVDLVEQTGRLSEVEPAAAIRSRFIYQNTMYELVGRILERVSGEAWDAFLDRRLWTPIGMNRTWSSRSQLPPDAVLVTPYYLEDGMLVQADWDRPAGDSNAAGSVLSTPADVAAWVQFLLRGGVTAGGNRLLSEAAVEALFSPQVLVDREAFYPTAQLTAPNWTSYGLGWFQQDFQGRKIDFHTGSLSGLIALIGLDRERRVGMFVLGNRDHAEMRHAILWEVMDADAGTRRRDWGKEVFALYEAKELERRAEWQKQLERRLEDTEPSLPPEAYLGAWEEPVIGRVTLAPAGTEWALRMDRRDLRVSHWHHDVFLVEYRPWGLRFFAQFGIGPDGEVETMDLFGRTFRRAAK